MTAKNAWIDSILQITPDYPEIVKQWKHMLDNGPLIVTRIESNYPEWDLEVYPKSEFEQFDPLWFSEEIYNRLYWCDQQLSNWKDVRRKRYDIWAFQNKEDAEKFQTLYTLTWTH